MFQKSTLPSSFPWICYHQKGRITYFDWDEQLDGATFKVETDNSLKIRRNLRHLMDIFFKSVTIKIIFCEYHVIFVNILNRLRPRGDVLVKKLHCLYDRCNIIWTEPYFSPSTCSILKFKQICRVTMQSRYSRKHYCYYCFLFYYHDSNAD